MRRRCRASFRTTTVTCPSTSCADARRHHGVERRPVEPEFGEAVVYIGFDMANNGVLHCGGMSVFRTSNVPEKRDMYKIYSDATVRDLD